MKTIARPWEGNFPSDLHGGLIVLNPTPKGPTALAVTRFGGIQAFSIEGACDQHNIFLMDLETGEVLFSRLTLRQHAQLRKVVPQYFNTTNTAK